MFDQVSGLDVVPEQCKENNVHIVTMGFLNPDMCLNYGLTLLDWHLAKYLPLKLSLNLNQDQFCEGEKISREMLKRFNFSQNI